MGIETMVLFEEGKVLINNSVKMTPLGRPRIINVPEGMTLTNLAKKRAPTKAEGYRSSYNGLSLENNRKVYAVQYYRVDF